MIGRDGRNLDPDDADRHIAGYTISNDVSEREFQLEFSGQWDLGKSCETFNPLGPYLVTADEIQRDRHPQPDPRPGPAPGPAAF